MKSPMQKVKEAFGSKDKLVEELLGMVKKPADLSRDDLKKKLRSQSNLKLLAMVSREKKIRDQFGGRGDVSCGYSLLFSFCSRVLSSPCSA